MGKAPGRAGSPDLKDGSGPSGGHRRIVLGGSLLILAGAAILMGIITAEALFTYPYSTAGNTISDLGSTWQPGNKVREPSATIFNTTMIVTGLMIVGGAVLIRKATDSRALTVATTLLGVFVFLVGVFPGNEINGSPDTTGVHPVVASLTFLSGGVAAILAGRAVRPPFRYLSICLGAVALLALVFAAWLGDTKLGEGGVERWVAYPIVLWLVAFGAYVLGSDGSSDQTIEAAAPSHYLKTSERRQENE